MLRTDGGCSPGYYQIKPFALLHWVKKSLLEFHLQIAWNVLTSQIQFQGLQQTDQTDESKLKTWSLWGEWILIMCPSDPFNPTFDLSE